MTPTTRIEAFLAKICGEDAELPTPQARVELFLAVIAGGTYLLPEPQSRWELYLAKILGQDVELPVPVSRDDRYLAAIAGMEGAEAPPFPISRVEMYLAEWAAQSGAQYETVTGAIVSFETVRAAALRRLEVALSPIQSGTGDPSPDNVRPITGHTAVNVWVQPTHDTTADPNVTVTIPTPPGAVYGGTLDVLTGVLTVEWREYDGGDLNWGAITNSNYRNFYSVPGVRMPGNDSPLVNTKSSMYKGVSYNGATVGDDNYVWIRNGSEICVKDTTRAALSAEDFKTIVTGQQFIVRRAAPITYQLTPEEVTALLGENNVWSDGGDVTVEYRSN